MSARHSDHRHDGHPHAHGAARSAGSRHRGRLTAVFLLSAAYLLVEVAGAWWTHSLALLAEAGHMLTDVAGLGLALLAIRFGERAPTAERSYGHHRMEILAAVANAIVLIGLCGFILVEAASRLRHPEAVASQGMLLVAALGLGVNLVGMFVLRPGAAESLNLRAAYLEVASDAMTAAAVIAAAAVMWATRWYYADPLASALIGLLILPRTWRLLADAINVLLEGTPSDVDTGALRSAVGGTPGVAGLHDVHVWTLTSGMNAMSLHVVLADGASHDAVLAAVQKGITSQFSIHHVTVQVEGRGCAQNETHL